MELLRSAIGFLVFRSVTSSPVLLPVSEESRTTSKLGGVFLNDDDSI